jgi:SAM-dependent methyltransferase
MATPSRYVFKADPRARLQAAEDLLDEGSIHLLSRLGIRAGWRCLEVGAGGGSIAAWLARAVGPTGHVVATDVDTRALELLTEPNLEIRQHDIVRDPLPETFDVIHARLVLEHLAEREAVLDKLVASLSEGGWLLVEDVDYVSGVSVSDVGGPRHEHTQSVRLQEFARRGVDSYFGRRLPERLRARGLRQVGNEGRVWIMEGGSAGALWFKLSLAHLRDQLVGPGKLNDAEVDETLALFDDPGFAAFTPIIVGAWGQK